MKPLFFLVTNHEIPFWRIFFSKNYQCIKISFVYAICSFYLYGNFTSCQDKIYFQTCLCPPESSFLYFISAIPDSTTGTIRSFTSKDILIDTGSSSEVYNTKKVINYLLNPQREIYFDKISDVRYY